LEEIARPTRWLLPNASFVTDAIPDASAAGFVPAPPAGSGG
jgi:hypothetical protein